MADVELGEWDNRDLAWISLVVDPAHRRRGYGSELLSAAVDLGAQRGRTRVGAEAWDCPAAEPFAGRHGFVLAQTEAYRVVAPRELPPGLVDAVHAEARAHAGDYELVRLEGPAPEDLLPALAELTAVINDAPIGRPRPRGRRRSRSSASAATRSHDRLRPPALPGAGPHRSTGEAAGHTIVSRRRRTPQWRTRTTRRCCASTVDTGWASC